MFNIHSILVTYTESKVVCIIVDIGNVLKRLRKKKRLTQSELGSLVGVTKAAISKYEKAASFPPYDILIAFSQIFNVPIDYLFGIEKKEYIYIEGLTDSQLESLAMIAQEYRKANAKDQ